MMSDAGWRLSRVWRLPSPTMRSLAAEQPARFYLLDGTRAFAALVILLYHYQHFFIPIDGRRPVAPWSRGPLDGMLGEIVSQGFLAVPIFWMISGFVFSRAYLPAPTGAASFARNRFARLYPLHLLTLLAVAGLQLLCIAQFGQSQIFRNTDLYHFGLHLAFAARWGFEHGHAFNGPIWSVSVEVLIYAAFWVFHRRLHSFGVILPLLAATGLGVLLWHVSQNQIAQCGYFFFLGSALYLAYTALRQAGWPVAALGLALLAGAVPALAWGSAMQFRYLGVPAAFGGFLLLLAMLESYVPKRAHKPLGALGDSSYGLYLWHVPVQLCLFLALGAGIAAAAESWAFLATYLAIVIVVAWAGYVGFERPMREWLRRGSLTEWIGRLRDARSQPEAAAGQA